LHEKRGYFEAFSANTRRFLSGFHRKVWLGILQPLKTAKNLQFTSNQWEMHLACLLTKQNRRRIS